MRLLQLGTNRAYNLIPSLGIVYCFLLEWNSRPSSSEVKYCFGKQEFVVFSILGASERKSRPSSPEVSKALE